MGNKAVCFPGQNQDLIFAIRIAKQIFKQQAPVLTPAVEHSLIDIAMKIKIIFSNSKIKGLSHTQN